jgi:hypothetical protein
MSDTNTTSPQDAIIETLRDRERGLIDEDRALLIRREVIAGRLDEVRDLIATLSRKPRARKPRVSSEPETLRPPEEAPAPKPSVFAPVRAVTDDIVTEAAPATTEDARPALFAPPRDASADTAEAA